MPKNPIEQFFAELADEIDKAFEAASGPEEGQEQDVTTEPEAEAKTDLSPASLAREAIRVLKQAETTTYIDEGEQLIRIADRYIRLSEIALID